MSNPRIRRLRLDHERLNSRFQDWGAVQVCGLSGTPPEQYQITYAVKGIYAAPDGRILERDQHTVEINLSLAYPRRAPHCKILTPIFHPNFDEASVCIGDFWAASEGLDELIIRIGRMIAYQDYNTKSPLNGLAARWADEHSQMLPVDRREIAPPLEAPTTEDTPEKLVVELPNGEDEAQTRLPEPQLRIEGTVIALGSEVTTIGRNDDSHIQIADISVSWNHAQIMLVGEDFHIRDLGSTNGTRINGERVVEAKLKPGDKVTFGKIEAVYL